MKAKDLVFRLKSNLAQKFHRQYCKNGGDKSFTTYLWSKVDIVSVCIWYFKAVKIVESGI